MTGYILIALGLDYKCTVSIYNWLSSKCCDSRLAKVLDLNRHAFLHVKFGLESRNKLLYGSGSSRRTESSILPHLAIIMQHVWACQQGSGIYPSKRNWHPALAALARGKPPSTPFLSCQIKPMAHYICHPIPTDCMGTRNPPRILRDWLDEEH